MDTGTTVIMVAAAATLLGAGFLLHLYASAGTQSLVASVAAIAGVLAAVFFGFQAHQDARPRNPENTRGAGETAPGSQVDASATRGKIDIAKGASSFKGCRYTLSGSASVSAGSTIVVSTTRDKPNNAQTYYEAQVTWDDGDVSSGRWSATVTLSQTGTYSTQLIAIPEKLASYLKTMETHKKAGNTYWVSPSTLPPYSLRLDADSVTRIHDSGHPDSGCSTA